MKELVREVKDLRRSLEMSPVGHKSDDLGIVLGSLDSIISGILSVANPELRV